jgi:hypothetical protein
VTGEEDFGDAKFSAIVSKYFGTGVDIGAGDAGFLA